jgi:hypothetical protein
MINAPKSACTQAMDIILTAATRAKRNARRHSRSRIEVIEIKRDLDKRLIRVATSLN